MYEDIELKKLEDELKTILGKSRSMSKWSDLEDIKYLKEAIQNYNNILSTLPEDMKKSILKTGFKMEGNSKDVAIPASLILEISIRCLEEFNHELKEHIESDSERISLQDSYDNIKKIIKDLQNAKNSIMVYDKDNAYSNLNINQDMITTIRRATKIEFNVAKFGNQEYLQLSGIGRVKRVNEIDYDHYFSEETRGISDEVPVFTDILAKMKKEETKKLNKVMNELDEIGKTYFKEGKIPTSSYMWKEHLKDINSLSYDSQTLLEDLLEEYSELLLLDNLPEEKMAYGLKKYVNAFTKNIEKEKRFKEVQEREYQAMQIKEKCKDICVKYFKKGKFPISTYDIDQNLIDTNIPKEVKESIERLVEKINNIPASNYAYVDYWETLKPYVEDVYAKEQVKEKKKTRILDAKKDEYKTTSFFQKLKEKLKLKQKDGSKKI